ncbi:LytR/AlgR family response regulator transcription factor [Vibrio albus]|nr:LytTR family DNA-binding domain-containing protein [Vibrio albus]
MTSAVIADDEPLLRHHLNRMLADSWAELEIIGRAENGLQALELIEQHHPDIAFLDIRMPELDGMALAARLKNMSQPPLVVFITAYDEYAVRAFEQNAVDYLLKPLNDKRLWETCEKLQKRLDERHQGDNTDNLSALVSQLQHLQQNAKPDYLAWIKAAKGEEIYLIPVAEVLFFRAEDKYVSVLKQTETGCGEEFIIRTSLKELMQRLDPDLFWQVHRSSVVNVSAIEKVKKGITGQMKVVISGYELPVSRNAQPLFKGM